MSRGSRIGLAHGQGVEIWPHTCQGGRDLASHMARGLRFGLAHGKGVEIWPYTGQGGLPHTCQGGRDVASNLSRGVKIWPCSCQRCQNLVSDMSRGSRFGLAHVEGVEQIIITQANVMSELCGRSGGWGAACCSESC